MEMTRGWRKGEGFDNEDTTSCTIDSVCERAREREGWVENGW